MNTHEMTAAEAAHRLEHYVGDDPAYDGPIEAAIRVLAREALTGPTLGPTSDPTPGVADAIDTSLLSGFLRLVLNDGPAVDAAVAVGLGLIGTRLKAAGKNVNTRWSDWMFLELTRSGGLIERSLNVSGCATRKGR